MRIVLFRYALACVALLAACGTAALAQVGQRTTAPLRPLSTVTLADAQIRLTLAPDLGGRIIALSSETGTNLLLANPQALPAGTMPSPDGGYYPILGHIIWLAPQHGWWNQQTCNSSRTGQDWPPDPYLEYGQFQIQERRSDKIVLMGPKSPVSGAQLTKSYELQPDHGLTITARAKNTRATPISWNLWSNTRVSNECAVYLRGTAHDATRTDRAARFDISYRDSDGWLIPTWPDQPTDQPMIDGKWYVDATTPIIVVFSTDSCLVKMLTDGADGKPHPDHERIEVYMKKSTIPAMNICELEMHGAYQTLQSGQELSLTEKWRLLPYHGSADHASHVQFLRDHVIPELEHHH